MPEAKTAIKYDKSKPRINSTIPLQKVTYLSHVFFHFYPLYRETKES